MAGMVGGGNEVLEMGAGRWGWWIGGGVRLGLDEMVRRVSLFWEGE